MTDLIDRRTLADEFRDAMATVCTPVAVVTAMDGDRPHGTTVSAFASLSIAPPMVLVSLDAGSDLLALMRHGGRFGLNVLGSDHARSARVFARKGADKFNGIAWGQREGVPRLDGVPAWLACEIADMVPGGDHVILLGRVVAAESGVGAPLTFHLRAFGTHAVLDA
jgi:flavin reductase (DIM6/NTAB) family NADH-FMN oxidoreductase RutF